MLRFRKGQRSWRDAHNLGGVLALPFHLMITYTGLAALLFNLFPWVITANYGEREAFFDAAPPHPEVEASGRPAPVLPLNEIAALARAAGNNFVPATIRIDHPGDANALVVVRPNTEILPSRRSRLYLHGVTGPIMQMPHERGIGARVGSAMVDLHAGGVLRWLYFLSGVAGTAMIVTGLILWTVKRRARLRDEARPHFGFRLVEWLNIGVVAGAPVGIATYFIANRL